MHSKSLIWTCSSPWELFNGVSHSTYTHRDQVDSQLFVVGSQIASLTPGPSFNHNLYWRCPNTSCEAISDIYTSRAFQRYKEHLNARCCDPSNCVLNFWESQRTLKSHFQECEWRPHTSLKVGLQQCSNLKKLPSSIGQFNALQKNWFDKVFKLEKITFIYWPIKCTPRIYFVWVFNLRKLPSFIH
jgi:hypothetical protein